ncbi:MAG: L,D-transpeptidase [bacterium]
MGMPKFFRSGSGIAWGLIGAIVLLAAASTTLFARTAIVRHERDVSRMVFNDNLQLLDEVRKSSGALEDSLSTVNETADPVATNKPYIVVSIEDHRLWYKQGNDVLFTAPVATGSGRVLDGSGNGQWKFETPRGRLVINAKEADPAWVPPDWHFVEQARKRGLGIVRLARGQTIAANDGSQITVNGTDVVKRYPDGHEVAVGAAKEGHEIIAGGNIIIPPYGTNQRKYMGVLGTHRLEMGDGYGIHGTDEPESIGKSASHGCVRLLNADIDKLYDMVAVGTPVYIY